MFFIARRVLRSLDLGRSPSQHQVVVQHGNVSAEGARFIRWRRPPWDGGDPSAETLANLDSSEESSRHVAIYAWFAVLCALLGHLWAPACYAIHIIGVSLGSCGLIKTYLITVFYIIKNVSNK